MATRTAIALTILLLAAPLPLYADQIVPSERVVTRVVIRAEPTSASTQIGSLRPGDSTNYHGQSGRWYKIRLTDGRDGYVSKSWTRRLQGPSLASASTDSDDELRIHFLNIGAGTCTVVECPGPDAPPLIIDCGSLGGSRTAQDLEPDEAKAVVQSILAAHSTPPNLVLSHGDRDHYTYIPVVLEDIEVGHVWQGDSPGEYGEADGPFRVWLKERKANGAKLNQNLSAHYHHDGYPLGDKLPCGDAEVYILTVNSGDTKNGKSLMVSVEYGDFAAIFTGDAEGVTEAQAIANYAGAVKATVLSGSHHGADTHHSNDRPWAEATAPAVTIYSSGIVETFGHPRCKSTERYHKSLSTAASHRMHCCTKADYTNREQFDTTKAEYSTEASGKIVVTSTGESPLSLKCEHGPGCDVQIAY